MSDPLVFEADSPAGRALEPFFFLTHGAGGDLSSKELKTVSSIFAASGHLSVRGNLPYRAAGRKSPPAAEKSVPGFIQTFEKVRAEFGRNARWIAGGRSYGGRVASMAAAQGLKVSGLMFFPYPLHRPGDPSSPRVEHWPHIKVPCLFIQGTKDPFCSIPVLEKSLSALGAEHTLVLIQNGDHSLKAGGRPQSEVTAQVGAAVSEWLKKIAPKMLRNAEHLAKLPEDAASEPAKMGKTIK